MKIGNALKNHGRVVCLLLATVIALILSYQAVFLPIYPVTDGQGYAMRGFALYGFWHAGEWANFWELFRHPNQSICPPHYLFFFMVPQALAGTAAYVLAQTLTTYLLLAAATFKLCQVLNREAWAPAIFLFCAVNNVALTDYYFFYLDMEFFSIGLYVVALQLTAWKEMTVAHSILSGLAPSLLFWMKPANALILLVVFILCELFRGTQNLLFCKSPAERSQSILKSLLHWGYQSLGFIPSAALALYCGGAQTILQLIQSNEINDTTTPLDCGGLTRLLYFPFCLSFFYHVLLLGGLWTTGFLISRIWLSAQKSEDTDFLGHLFIPAALAYLVWGEFFSFWIQAKGMRSLLPMLPLCWIALFWLFERLRLRSDVVFFVAALYASLAFSQKTFDLLGTKSSWRDDTYQISSASWWQMPGAWKRPTGLGVAICDEFGQHPPPPGIICVNTIELQKKLAWRLEAQDLLLGKVPQYDVRIIFNFKGDYYNRTFVGASLILLQQVTGNLTKTEIGPQSTAILQYGLNEWINREHCARLFTLKYVNGDPYAYLLYFPHTLSTEQVVLANRSGPFSSLVPEDNDGSAPLTGPHFSRAEAWDIIKAWYDKRTGLSP